MSKKISALDMPDVPMGQLPEHLQVQRTCVICKEDAPIHTESVQYSGAYATMGIDNSLQLENFCNNFKIEVTKLTEEVIEFDMIGIDAALANAFRRILIAEVETMAIEKVLVANNTSVIADEVLAHRLGLIPLNADPRLFKPLTESETPNEQNTIVFKLHVSCPKNGPRETVLSRELTWLPGGSQFEMETRGDSSKMRTYTSFNCSQDTLPGMSKLGPTHDDIILAKLGPGQEIELEAHAVKGNGKTHAKWSPVCTAWYRMLPEVILKNDILGEEAEEVVESCPVNVFDIEDTGKGEKEAVVARPRACTLCRECLRKNNGERVEVRRRRDHFVFTIESTGALPPEVLFTEAVKILEEKARSLIGQLSVL